jgi:hypothetical protein
METDPAVTRGGDPEPVVLSAVSADAPDPKAAS